MPPSRREIHRREFLKLAAAAPAITLAGSVYGEERSRIAGEGKMPLRPLGKTGLEVSEIAFGAHGVDNPPLMGDALEAGINTYCTSGHYLDGMEEISLGKAIQASGARRDRLVLLTGNAVSAGETKRSILESIEASLRRLRTDHIDVYYASMVRTPAGLRVEALYEAFEEARRAGKALHLGMSGHHGGLQDCLETALEDGRIEVFFIKYDFVSYPDVDRILRRASQRGIGTIVFKTNAGNRQKEIKDLQAGGLSFPRATVKWALTNPDVSSVAVTITNFDQIRTFTAAAGSKLDAAEIDMLRRYAAEMYHKYCRFCGTCEASCPRQVAVADVMRYDMYFEYYGREKDALRMYDALPGGCSAATCERCTGPCDAACPFGRQVRAELVQAHRRLSFSRA
jgi:aryl-alcohol dehydrogenase-like predicted oxidoreductase